MVPFGREGTKFLTGLTNLFNCYGNASALECIALKAALMMPALLLQCTHCHSRSCDHLACLEHCLPLWNDGNNYCILTLLEEGNIIQQHLPSRKGSNSSSSEDTVQFFTGLMF